LALDNLSNTYDFLKEKFDDGNDYCLDWSKEAIGIQFLIYVVPLAIIFINWLAKKILRTITVYEGRQSKPELLYSSGINMFIISFIDVAVAIQLVYFEWLPGVESVFFSK